jgi:broad specificity phosphatase PhoE
MRIFLIRHGESEANLDHGINKIIPDHDIPLSMLGMEQAQEAGRFLNKFFKDHPAEEFVQNVLADNIFGTIMSMAGQQGKDIIKMKKDMSKIRLWNSPYKRARETASVIGGLINEHVKDTREDVLLCEQQFGLFDGMNDNEQRENFPIENACFMKQKGANGKFWARYPMGESAFDVSCRLRQFNGTLNRDDDEGIRDHIIVCHGSVSRLFVMTWLHYKYEWFEEERNPGNCSIRLIDNAGQSGYVDKGYIFGGWKEGSKWKPQTNSFTK